MIMTRGVFFSMHGIFKSLFFYCCKITIAIVMMLENIIRLLTHYNVGLSDNYSFAILSTSAMKCHTSVESIITTYETTRMTE